MLPRDRILPLIGGQLLRSSTVPAEQGVVLASAGSPIDLVVARDISVSFLQQTVEPRYAYRVSERFTWRVKDSAAVVRLERAGE